MSKVKDLVEGTYKKATILTHLEKSLSQISYKALCLIVFHVNTGGKKIRGKYYFKKKLARQLTLGWKTKGKDIFYNGLDELYDNEIVWNYLGKDYAFKRRRLRLLIDLSEPSDKGHYYAFSLHPELEEYIKNPKIYGQQRIIMMAILNRPKSCFRLYDILIDAYSRGDIPFRIYLNDLRRELGFLNKAAYTNWTDFKRYILEPNIKIINKKSDLQVVYKTFKNGRKVDGCYFDLKKQSWQMPFNEMLLQELKKNYIKEEQNNIVLVGESNFEEDIQYFINETYAKYSVSKKTIEKVIEMYGLEGAIEIRDYALLMHLKNEKENLGAYMGECFREGYGLKTIKDKMVENKKEAIKNKKALEQRKIDLINDLKKAFNEELRKKTDQIIKKIGKDEMAKLKEDFVANKVIQDETPLLFKEYQKKKFKSSLIKINFNFYIQERLLSSDEKDFKTYVQSRGYKLDDIHE